MYILILQMVHILMNKGRIIQVIRSIYCEVKKLVLSPAFAAGVLLVVVLCMMTVAYVDNATGKAYTLIEVFSLRDQQLRLSLSAYKVFLDGLTGQYSLLFLPLSVSVTFIPLYCAERKSGMQRMQIIRQSKTRFALARALGSMLCGGLVVMTGFLVYGLIVYALIPHSMIADESLVAAGFINTDESFIVTNILKKIASTFLEGVELSCLPLLLYMIIKDVYFIICIPVLFYFIIGRVVFVTIDSPLGNLFQYLEITGAQRILFVFDVGGLIIVAGLPVLTIIAFLIWNKRKRNCDA